MQFEIDNHNSYLQNTLIQGIGLLLVGIIGVISSLLFVNLNLSGEVDQLSAALDQAEDQTDDVIGTDPKSSANGISVLGNVVIVSEDEELSGENAESTGSHSSAPELIGTLADIDQFSAASILVRDYGSGATIFSKQADAVRPLASITKLMTALVLYDAIDNWNNEAVVVDAGSPESHVYVGESYTYEDLWVAMLVGSSNRAAKTLVQAIFPDDETFLAEVTKQASDIGMTDYAISEPTGLDDGNTATAADVLLLLGRALENEKITRTLNYQEAIITENHTGNTRLIRSTNLLLLGWVPSHFERIIGGKTGYTQAAGYNYTMRIEGDGGVLLDVVVLGTDSKSARFSEARDVIENVLQNYQWDVIGGG